MILGQFIIPTAPYQTWLHSVSRLGTADGFSARAPNGIIAPALLGVLFWSSSFIFFVDRLPTTAQGLLKIVRGKLGMRRHYLFRVTYAPIPSSSLSLPSIHSFDTLRDVF